jgi:hypothetical protein
MADSIRDALVLEDESKPEVNKRKRKRKRMS